MLSVANYLAYFPNILMFAILDYPQEQINVFYLLILMLAALLEI